jgi:hypothetical protein
MTNLGRVICFAAVGIVMEGCAAAPMRPATTNYSQPVAPGSLVMGSNAQPSLSSSPSDSTAASYQIGVKGDSWKPLPQPQNFSDLYTRIQLVSTEDVGAGEPNRALRNYRAENRDWVSRLISSRTDTVTTVANVIVREPSLTVTIPLFSVSHASGLKLGNSWNTVYTASSMESPLFRIGPNTALTLHLSAKVSSDLKSQGVSFAIGAVTTAVRIAAPTSPLLTSLSKPEANNAANAIDAAISSLMSHDISEDVDIGRMADSWAADSHLSLFGCAPFVKAGDQPQHPSATCAVQQDIGGDADIAVGQWELRLACPRLSAFDPRDICHGLSSGTVTIPSPPVGGVIDIASASGRATAYKIVADSVSDATILAFNLSSQVTIASFVQSQGWFTTFSAAATRKRSDYDGFCYGGLVGLEQSGLSKFDSALAMRAIIRQMPQMVSADWSGTSTTSEGCLKMLAGVGVSI